MSRDSRVIRPTSVYMVGKEKSVKCTHHCLNKIISVAYMYICLNTNSSV